MCDQPEPISDASVERDKASLRDQFAIAALQGVLSTYRDGGTWPKGGFMILARGAYLIAEAMLEARAWADKPTGTQGKAAQPRKDMSSSTHRPRGKRPPRRAPESDLRHSNEEAHAGDEMSKACGYRTRGGQYGYTTELPGAKTSTSAASNRAQR